MDRATAKKRRARISASAPDTVPGSPASFVNRISEAAAVYSSEGFLPQVGSALLDVVGCDAVELVVRRGDEVERCDLIRAPSDESYAGRASRNEAGSTGEQESVLSESAIARLFHPDEEPLGPLLWNGDGEWVTVDGSPSGRLVPPELKTSLSVQNPAALVPFTLGERDRVLLLCKYHERGPLSIAEVRFLEATTRILSLVFENRPVAVALEQRIRELTCLHAIARIRAERNASTDEQLERIVKVLPPAWQYPQLVGAGIEIDGKVFCTRPAPEDGAVRLSADIEVRGQKHGVVEVFYASSDTLPRTEAPFLDEERTLLDTVAKELTLMFERKLAESEEAKVLAQLRHADRLATIGQLSAGVAHEINEPLSSILGFAQLIAKESSLTEQVRRDLEKIERAALQGRAIVQNLLLFARQAPEPEQTVDLNRVIEDALGLLQPGLTGYDVDVTLDPSLPTIVGDRMHLSQVVVNLVTNAVQAMPNGGRLRMHTIDASQSVCLVVEDSGEGMNDEVAQGVFLPFFTTKAIGEGTGLGLSVVHGIVTSHGGTITVESQEGVGTRFEVRFPVLPETSG